MYLTWSAVYKSIMTSEFLSWNHHCFMITIIYFQSYMLLFDTSLLYQPTNRVYLTLFRLRDSLSQPFVFCYDFFSNWMLKQQRAVTVTAQQDRINSTRLVAKADKVKKMYLRRSLTWIEMLSRL